ncbi:hypothetical protein MAUB1S_05127 [Mycolicibacterium aubagnense]
MTNSDEIAVLRVSDADRNGTLRRLHNAVALGLIDMDEFSERSALVALARQQAELAVLVGDLPAPNAIVTASADRVELRAVMGSLKRQGERGRADPARAGPPSRLDRPGPDPCPIRRAHRGHRTRSEVQLA